MPSLAEARALDAADPLAGWRGHFALPPGIVYLDGNSLGALPLGTASRLGEVVRREWGEGLVRSWNAAGWIDAPRRVGALIAPLIGAEPHEVIACDSTSVNLFKLIAAALMMRPGRKVVLSEPGNFPTDLYMIAGLEAQGLAKRRLASAEWADRVQTRAAAPSPPAGEGGAPSGAEGEGSAAPAADAARGTEAAAGAADPSPNPLPQGERAKALEAALDEDVALLLLTHVHYKTGAMHDMAVLTRAAHDVGALVLWDLSHSAGAVPVDLNGCEADLAVGCGYKYLNGGPGAPAFAYVAARHHEALQQPLTGWMGHAAPFAFTDDYAPAVGIDRLLTGTPPILGLAALEEGVKLIADIGIERLVAKSRALSEFLRAAVAQAASDLPCISPKDPARRGSQLAFRHPQAYAVCQALIARGVIGDFREPDMLRFGLAPAYIRFEDCWNAAQALGEVLASGEWERAEYRQRAAVT